MSQGQNKNQQLDRPLVFATHFQLISVVLFVCFKWHFSKIKLCFCMALPSSFLKPSSGFLPIFYYLATLFSSWSCHFMSKWYCWWKKSCTQLIGSASHSLQRFIHPNGGWMYDFWTINSTTSRNNARIFFRRYFHISKQIAIFPFAGGTRFDGGISRKPPGPVLLLDFDSKAISKHCAQALGTIDIQKCVGT